MNKTRTIAMTVAAGATLVAGVALAGPAAAVDPVSVTALPANVTIQAGGSVSVNVPSASVCAVGTTNFKAFTPGKQSALKLNTMPGAGCSGPGGGLNYSISDNPDSKKKNGVVKFTATKSDGSKVVLTLVVHVKGQQLLGSSNENSNGKGHGKGNS